MAPPDAPSVEVAYALPARQWVVVVPLREGMTAAEALEASGLLSELAELRRPDLPLGIFGRRVQPSQPLRDGDRVEIYRPLSLDPREARRRAVEAERRSTRARPAGRRAR